ncbi:MAG: FAD-binding protein [Actinobacteria bacterium]|nr:FAD-binding protein [Actinomycetota bacterium]
MWDVEVDIICVGAGAGALASAVAAADQGLDVFMATPGVQHPDIGRQAYPRTHAWLDAEIPDPETNDYFMALSCDVGPLRPGARDGDVCFRVVHDQPPANRKRSIEPFFGARLRDWATRCLVSPFGYLDSRVAGPDTTTMRTRSGEALEVTVVGAFAPGSGSDVPAALCDWLGTRVRGQGVTVSDDTPLQRIVFEEGDVVGAVFATPGGPLAVQARRGITVAAGGVPVDVPASRPMSTIPDLDGVDVCLVSQSASRFGRVELLRREPAAALPATGVFAPNHPWRDPVQENRPARSQTRRGGKVHGNPPLGQ